MSAWISDQLDRIDAADELEIAPRRRDGSLRAPVTIWFVRLGDDIYVRSVNGPSASWFRGATATGEARIAAGGVEADVALAGAPPELADDLDAAYRSKYRRYSGPVAAINSPGARSAALLLRPQAAGG